MAGGHGDHNPLRVDPAIERWAHMREHVYENFKFTRRNTRFLTVWGLVIPGLLIWGSLSFYDRYDIRGLTAGDNPLKHPPSTQQKSTSDKE
ncbi:hypothetical protein BD324DRAFT_628780 [Kockovaella imperatae]|uniref:NADH dehydrogenase [ubiquinone] 1 beta subcomplex subunit 4 n=1 Tax=Kockovaella imperatae TaxID=4999 RepID=A0A1Y1UEG0_9TREE|nr:hypothetical protein BD324DRAFT_628780 [Kockovaella imperatae]ORX36418.1 hypothetical protein BD324DRAFT_628780 [Kockovaella imperatae]